MQLLPRLFGGGARLEVQELQMMGGEAIANRSRFPLSAHHRVKRFLFFKESINRAAELRERRKEEI